MGIFNKGNKKDSITDFEKAFVQKEKVNPVIKAGSTVFYLTVIIAVFACIFMFALDKTGVAPSPATVEEQKIEKAEAVDVSNHPESLQKLYRENFETADFVASYFDQKDKVKEVNIKKYKRSKQIPLFIQWDKQWGYLTYGDDIAGVNGDGPMCLAMAGYYLTRDEKFSPDKIIAFSQENGFYKKGKGTLSTLMTDGATQLGLVSAEINPTAENIIGALEGEKPVICYIEKGNLAATSHFIVIRSVKDGAVFINDPTSVVNSEKQWIMDELLSQIKTAWVVSQ